MTVEKLHSLIVSSPAVGRGFCGCREGCRFHVQILVRAVRSVEAYQNEIHTSQAKNSYIELLDIQGDRHNNAYYFPRSQARARYIMHTTAG